MEKQFVKELTIVMPVYNEDEVIAQVLDEWLVELRRLELDFELCIYNDGSTDKTFRKINEAAKLCKELEVFDKNNSGHGPTILQGYRQSKGEWIFQTDSDNEISPGHFESLWNQRNENEFIIGNRTNRKSPISRKIISFISKWTVRILYGKGVNDVNSPFRLYKNEVFADGFKKIPSNTFAPNVILSGIACQKRMKIGEIPVNFSPRSTGEVSIKKWKLFKVALKSWKQTIYFRLKLISFNRFPK